MVLSDGQFRFMFTARNYEASVAFYQEGLGLPMDHNWDYGPHDRGTVFLAGPGMIEIFGRAPGSDYTKPQGVSMLLQVADADSAFVQVKDRGLTVVEEPTSYPWGHRVFRVSDPDGIVVSLFSVIQHLEES